MSRTMMTSVASAIMAMTALSGENPAMAAPEAPAAEAQAFRSNAAPVVPVVKAKADAPKSYSMAAKFQIAAAPSVADTPLTHSATLQRINDRSLREPGTVAKAFGFCVKAGLGIGVGIAANAVAPVIGGVIAKAVGTGVAAAFTNVAGWGAGAAVERGLDYTVKKLSFSSSYTPKL